LAEIQDEETAAYSARAALSLHNYYFFQSLYATVIPA